MGFLRKVMNAADAVLELADDSSEGIGPTAQNVDPVPLGPNASSLEELAALAASSDGTRGRAIVQSSEGVAAREGARTLVERENVRMVLRLRLAEGGFGPRVEKSPILPRDAGLVIGRGLELPVNLGPDGAIVDIDTGLLTEELRPQFAAAREEEKARRNRGLGFVVGAVRDGVDDLRTAKPDTPPPPDLPGGTSADLWLQARRALRNPRLREAQRSKVIAACGIKPDQWDAVDAGWTARAASDPALAARLAEVDG